MSELFTQLMFWIGVAFTGFMVFCFALIALKYVEFHREYERDDHEDFDGRAG